MTIALMGDVYLGAVRNVTLGPALAERLRTADLVVANLEGPLTEITSPATSSIALRMPPWQVDTLRAWGVGVVTLANNHMFDFGDEAFGETRRVLDAAGIQHYGAGQNLAEALAPHRFQLRGIAIALLAFACRKCASRAATATTAGCAPLDAELMLDAVRAARASADAVVVSPHWGICDYTLPPPDVVALGRRLLAAGADVVAGHHSHVVHGMQSDGARLAAYSLGNFFFADYEHLGRPQPITDDNRRGVVLLVTFTADGVRSHEVVFTRSERGSIEVDAGTTGRRRLARRSHPVCDPAFDRHWRGYIRRRAMLRALERLNPLQWHTISGGTFRRALAMLRGKSHWER